MSAQPLLFKKEPTYKQLKLSARQRDRDLEKARRLHRPTKLLLLYRKTITTQMLKYETRASIPRVDKRAEAA